MIYSFQKLRQSFVRQKRYHFIFAIYFWCEMYFFCYQSVSISISTLKDRWNDDTYNCISSVCLSFFLAPFAEVKFFYTTSHIFIWWLLLNKTPPFLNFQTWKHYWPTDWALSHLYPRNHTCRFSSLIIVNFAFT